MAISNLKKSSTLKATKPEFTKRCVKRCVCFEDEVKVICVQPVDESLKSDLFYARSDFRRFKKESKRIEKMLNDRLSLGSLMRGGSSSSSSRHRSLTLSSFRRR